MEYYLKSWDSVVQENRSFFRTKNKVVMKNSLELENSGDQVGCNESSADCLRIHCSIQTFSSLRDLKALRCQHCIGKTNPADCCWECDCDKNEFTGCIFIPEDTSMNDLLRTALLKLGYPPTASPFATGSVIIRNWSPLPLEVICPDMSKTVGQILGDITAVVTFRIYIFNPKLTAAQKMKDSLLFFLINANNAFLRESHCPFDAATLSKLCDRSLPLKMQFLQDPSDDLQRKFESWLENLQGTEKAESGRKSQSRDLFSGDSEKNWNAQYPESEKRITSPTVESSTHEGSVREEKTVSEHNVLVKETVFGPTERTKHSTAPPKTRVRTSFDPEFELPKLQKWFMKNPHPSRHQIYEYVGELNSLESRRGRKQLDVNNVVYWFKNARAAQKRTECRRFSNPPTAEANRCNVLKIPSGKNSGMASDDQRSVSDDEVSAATSESGDDFRQENSRCLQVVGKWNSNGQGEAVLEMQIPSRSSEFSQHGKKDKTTEEEEISLPEKRDIRTSEATTESQSIVGVEGNVTGTKISEATGNKMKQQKYEESVKVDILPKGQTTGFPSFKDDGAEKDSDFLTQYEPGFPVHSNPVLGSSFISMSHYISPKAASLTLSSEERRKRNRTFIDPVTEVPRLEQWFRLSTHPSHNLIARYTEELNSMPYRKKFPKLEAKNVQFWFKNRRAKNKRLNYLETNKN